MRNFQTASLAELHVWEAEYRDAKVRGDLKVIQLTHDLSQAQIERDNARFLADKVRWWIGQHDDDTEVPDSK